MNILAIDTSSRYFSLAIEKKNTVVHTVFKPYGRELSRNILPSIEHAFKKTGLTPKDIDCFGVGIGPGSFTGLRIGLAVIKGLAFPFNTPVCAVTSLDALAYALLHEARGLICPIVDAKRSLVYSALYRVENGALRRRGRYFLVRIEELLKKIKSKEEVVFTGDGISLYRGAIENIPRASARVLDEKFWYPNPLSLLSCVKEKIAKKEFEDLYALSPLYLYPKECQIGKKE